MIRKIIKDNPRRILPFEFCDAFLSEILTAMMIALLALVIKLSVTSRHGTDEALNCLGRRVNLKLISCCLPALFSQLDFQSCKLGQKGAEDQYGQIRIALYFVSDFRKCLMALGMRYVGGTGRFTSFDQSNKKAFMPSVSGHDI